jgi:hypothetical protein
MKTPRKILATLAVIAIFVPLLAGCAEPEHSTYCQNYGGQGEAALDACERQLQEAAEARY